MISHNLSILLEDHQCYFKNRNNRDTENKERKNGVYKSQINNKKLENWKERKHNLQSVIFSRFQIHYFKQVSVCISHYNHNPIAPLPTNQSPAEQKLPLG